MFLVTRRMTGPAWIALLILGVSALQSPAASVAGGLTRSLLDDEAAFRGYEEAATAAGAIGFYTDAATFVVVIPASLHAAFVAPDPTQLPVNVRVEDRAIDPLAIDAAMAKLHEVWRSRVLQDESYEYHFDPRTGRIAVAGSADPC